MLSSWIDRTLARTSRALSRKRLETLPDCHYVHASAGVVRIFDSGGSLPAVVLAPDGPNVIEHYQHLAKQLASCHRVVCFDMPGFGQSLPSAGYSHSLDAGAKVIRDVMDARGLGRATLAFSCANGFYALRLAQREPGRVSRLILSQTPSLESMQAWARRIIPRPLFLPVVGQIANWAGRTRAAQRWYRHALPEGSRDQTFGRVCAAAFSAGACFCLASVVQAMIKESPDSLRIGNTPCTLIWGTQDRSHATTRPESIRTHAPHAKIISYENTGHFPDLERVDWFTRIVDGSRQSSCT